MDLEPTDENLQTNNDEKKKLKYLKGIYIATYSLLQSILFTLCIGYLYKLLAPGPNIFVIDVTLLTAILFMTIPFRMINEYIIDRPLNDENATRLAFIQIFIITIFLFSFVQNPDNFYLIGLYWCAISPIGNLLSIGVFLIPYIKNRKMITIIGAISTAIGFAAKFYTIPYINIIVIPLTITGALLTVIGIGSPPENHMRARSGD